jgi:hypothetical protein
VIGAVKDFGVMAVMGRPTLTAGEILRMQSITNFIEHHAILKRMGDYTAFAKKYPYWAARFTQVAEWAQELD